MISDVFTLFFFLQFPDREFLLRVSYMEIYNETITDLLCDTQKMKPLIIREDFNVSNRVEVALKIDLLIGVIILEYFPLISIFFKLSPICMVYFFLGVYGDSI